MSLNSEVLFNYMTLSCLQCCAIASEQMASIPLYSILVLRSYPNEQDVAPPRMHTFKPHRLLLIMNLFTLTGNRLRIGIWSSYAM